MAGSGGVSLTSTTGSILNGGTGTYADNLVAGSLRLSRRRGSGVGLPATHLIANVGTFTAAAGSGGIFLTNDAAIAVGHRGRDRSGGGVPMPPPPA